jgi:hypothetical protein
MIKLLFVNHNNVRCGVYQYGLNIYRSIKKLPSYVIDYAECSNGEQFAQALAKDSYDAVIYNYYDGLLPFVDPLFRAFYSGLIHICLVHEISQEIADRIDNSLFDYFIYADPTFERHNPRVFTTGRLLPSYSNPHPLPHTVTVGSFGFAGRLKRFEDLIDLVQHEFDRAIIRINIPFNDVVDKEGKNAKQCADRCKKRLKKEGVELHITHDFFSPEGLLDFLGKNTINVLPYEELGYPALSSAADYAIASGRPLAVSDCSFFRHLFTLRPTIVLNSHFRGEFFRKIDAFQQALRLYRKRVLFHKYPISFKSLWSRFFCLPSIKKRSLKEILSAGTLPLQPLYQEWSEENYLNQIQSIFQKIESFEKAKSPFKSFNRILDDQARIEYEQIIQEMRRLAPEIIQKKIHRANVQQAFVFDSVKHFAHKNSLMLCVGGYHDTACYSLEKLGASIVNIDPELNYDLKTFKALPTTQKGSFDLIFSTSVVEHVEDDEQFFSDIEELLKPGGVGILTCDFKNSYCKGDPLFPGNYRFYTVSDLKERILPLLKECTLVDLPTWESGTHDFKYEGQEYAFGTLVFRKNSL